MRGCPGFVEFVLSPRGVVVMVARVCGGGRTQDRRTRVSPTAIVGDRRGGELGTPTAPLATAAATHATAAARAPCPRCAPASRGNDPQRPTWLLPAGVGALLQSGQLAHGHGHTGHEAASDGHYAPLQPCHAPPGASSAGPLQREPGRGRSCVWERRRRVPHVCYTRRPPGRRASQMVVLRPGA